MRVFVCLTARVVGGKKKSHSWRDREPWVRSFSKANGNKPPQSFSLHRKMKRR